MRYEAEIDPSPEAAEIMSQLGRVHGSWLNRPMAKMIFIARCGNSRITTITEGERKGQEI